jgi:hypothetical protein
MGHAYGVQSWSFGISFSCVNSVIPGDLVAWLALLDTPFASWWNTATNGPKFQNGTTTQFEGTRVVFYPAGARVGTAVANRSFGSPLAGTGSTYQPPQVSLVVSLGSGLAGKRGRGRVYVPWTAGNVTSTGTIGSSLALTHATAFKTLLTAISATTLAGSGVAPVIATPTAAAGGVTDLPPRPITSLGVGVALDTQRRRRNKLADLKQTLAFP